MPSRGRFITFEGPEGGGKTTQAQRLVARLGENGIAAVYTREPGGTKLGEAIRSLLQFDGAGEPPCPEAEVLLFAASRAQLVRKVILPQLEKGLWVIADRFADSTTAYQGFGRGFSLDDILRINRFAIDGVAPDLTIILDIDVKEGLRRLKERHILNGTGLDRLEREDLPFHERIREGYLELARLYPERIRVVDASKHSDIVAEEVWALVQDVCGPSISA
ncbi:MAG: dTMP kinase [Verrucomicrobia bacterium]|nr:MAG: dTMP kinase [Verrucomicrobiota bacterium]